MEMYAGFLEHTDHHVGRVIDAIEDLGVLENTLIYYIIGDNGALLREPSTVRSTRWRTSTAWPHSRPPSTCCRGSMSSAPPPLTTITRWGGRGQ